MARLAAQVVVWILAVIGMALSATAQQSVPDFRFVTSRDVDFYGDDLDALFDTDLQSCVRACSANSACGAFTFNTRSNACFPKRGVTERTAYEGAFSAEKRATDPQVRSAAQSRIGQLAFLGQGDLDAALTMARDLGLRHAAGGLDLQQMVDTARAR